MSSVTQPAARSSATSPRVAASDSGISPWVTLPTLQLPWSAGTVLKVLVAASIQNTHPAGTRPVRPSGSAGGMGPSNAGTSPGGNSAKVMAIGGDVRWRASLSVAARVRQSVEVVMGRTLSTVARRSSTGFALLYPTGQGGEGGGRRSRDRRFDFARTGAQAPPGGTSRPALVAPGCDPGDLAPRRPQADTDEPAGVGGYEPRPRRWGIDRVDLSGPLSRRGGGV